MSTARDALRAKVLADKPKSTVVTLEDGVKVEVRQATVGAMLDSLDIEDTKQRMGRMLIISCFVPETGEALFEEGDIETLMSMPTGGYYQKLIDAVSMWSPNKGVQDAKKNSETTPSSE